MPDVSVNDLQFQESRRLVVAAMKQRGFVETKYPADAALAVFIKYGIGNPTQQTYEYLVPQLGLVPQSTSVQGTVTTSGNTSTVAATATTQTRLGVTGYETAVQSYTTYGRYLLVTALDLDYFRVTKEARELWKTGVVSVGSSSDLRLVLPYLVVAGSPYLGSSTDHLVDQLIREDDPRVTMLKTLAKSN